jgi:magnesium transporter
MRLHAPAIPHDEEYDKQRQQNRDRGEEDGHRHLLSQQSSWARRPRSSGSTRIRHPYLRGGGSRFSPRPVSPAAGTLQGTAGEAAVADVPTASPSARAADVREALTGRRLESATEIVVLAGARFVGVVTIERLLASTDATVGDLVEEAPRVSPEADLEAAARATARSGGRSIAVVDSAGRFLGLVPPTRLLRHLELEHEEDLARLGGSLRGVSDARAASEEAVIRRLWHRLPWLGLGLLGAMAAAVVVGAFEDEIKEQVLLAFFLPAVVYMADAVGTQTETVVIRGMALGVSVRKVFARELLTGLVIGALLGSAFFVFSLAVWHEEDVAAAVALSLAISCSIASVVAMALPYVLARFGRDPAFGAGPLATVIQDLLSIVAYFAIATLLVT